MEFVSILILVGILAAPFVLSWLCILCYEKHVKHHVQHKTIKIVLVGIALLVVTPLSVFYIYSQTPSERKAMTLLQLCRTRLTIGMTVKDLKIVMGEPLGIDRGDTDSEIFYYLSPRVASELTRVRIKDGKITGAVCGEGYGVYEPTTQNTTSTK